MHPITLAEAEDDLKAAYANAVLPVAPEIAAAEALVDRLDVKPTTAALGSAALWYASVGLPVFPLMAGTKIPFKGSRGCKDATTDAGQITAWWAANPDANIGLATGHLVDVVDVDGHAGQSSRVQHWDDIFAQVDTDAIAKVLTPRVGGMHIYVPATGDPNSANIVPSVDYRGLGGYVVAPPSRTPDGHYRFLGTPALERFAQGDAA